MYRSVLVLAFAGLLIPFWLVSAAPAPRPANEPTPEQLKEAQDAFARLGQSIVKLQIQSLSSQSTSSECHLRPPMPT